MGKSNRKASAVMEYAIVLGVVSMALTGMSAYLKRGIQAKTKDLTTRLIARDLYARHLAGECASLADPDCHQYVSGGAASESNTTYNSEVNQATSGNTTSNVITETITRTADERSVQTGWEDYL